MTWESVCLRPQWALQYVWLLQELTYTNKSLTDQERAQQRSSSAAFRRAPPSRASPPAHGASSLGVGAARDRGALVSNQRRHPRPDPVPSAPHSHSRRSGQSFTRTGAEPRGRSRRGHAPPPAREDDASDPAGRPPPPSPAETRPRPRPSPGGMEGPRS
ncbi:hypothetical protein H8959_017006 [Pygathrix nigripes]